MDQPPPGMFKRIVFSLLILLTLSGCRLVSYLRPFSPTVTPTITPTPTPEYCSWTWAYGDGSTEFDGVIIQKMAKEGVIATVKSSSFGEVNSCNQSFGAMALDVKIEIKVENLADQELLTKTSTEIVSLLKDNLSVSNVNNLGNVSLAYITPDGNTCFWNVGKNQCAE